jgi:hypothetical protein
MEDRFVLLGLSLGFGSSSSVIPIARMMSSGSRLERQTGARSSCSQRWKA